MSLSINRVSSPQINQNSSRKVAFGISDGDFQPTLEQRVSKLEEKSKLQGTFNHQVVETVEFLGSNVQEDCKIGFYNRLKALVKNACKVSES